MEIQDRFGVVPEAGEAGYPRINFDIGVDPEKIILPLAEKYTPFSIPGRPFEMDSRQLRIGFGGTPEEIEIGLNNLMRAIKDTPRG